MKDIAKLLANQGFVTSQGGYEMADNFFAQFGDDYTAFVAYHSAPAGFEAFSVMFGDSVPMRLVLKAENAMRMEAGAEIVTRRQMDGRMVMYFTAPLYPKIGAVIIGGGAEPTIDWWGLKLTMPEGGTVILRKNGSPNAVNLEVSTDGINWQPWTLVGTDYSYNLSAGQTLCIRNTSATVVNFNLGANDFWNFILDSDTYASGSIMSLVCNDETITSIAGHNNIFQLLFRNCLKLLQAPDIPILILSDSCFRNMFLNTGIKTAPEVPATAGFRYCMFGMYSGTNTLKEVTIHLTSTGLNGLNNWLSNVSATGDLYCPTTLTLPVGVSGIPSGWTRHDI